MPRTLNCRASVLVAGVVICSSSAVAAGPAEYAFRWEVLDGAPASADPVVTALKVLPEKVKVYEVLYFDVTQPTLVPAGYRALGRERGAKGGKPDATYKVRGTEPVPAELLDWKCPLAGYTDQKSEVDVAFLGLVEVKRTFSVSCALDKKGLKASLPAGYTAKARACKTTMERTTAASPALKVKIEKWSLPTGKVLIEVSMAGSDSEADFLRFRDQVVKPLIGLKAIPLLQSKTELGSDC